MTDTNDAIKELFSSWQKQYEATMKDPEVVGKSMELFYEMQQQFLKSCQPAESAASQPAAPTNPEHGNDAQCELSQRITELEARIEQLESQLAATAGKRTKKRVA